MVQRLIAIKFATNFVYGPYVLLLLIIDNSFSAKEIVVEAAQISHFPEEILLIFQLFQLVLEEVVAEAFGDLLLNKVLIVP